MYDICILQLLYVDVYIYLYIHTLFVCVPHPLEQGLAQLSVIKRLLFLLLFSSFPIAVYNCFFVLLLLFSLMFVFVISFSTCSSCLLVLSFNSFPYCMCFLS